MKIAAGVDIGGTNTVFGLVDQSGSILCRDSFPTNQFPEPDKLVNRICIGLHELIKKCDSNFELIGVGIGAPNGNYFTGTVDFAPNMGWKGIVPLVEMFEAEMKVKAILTNDANAAAMGEMIFGGAKGMKDFLFITLGTGLGSGIVANGQMIYGHDGFAGEVGHVIIKPNGRRCGCGRKGCLETYCSATGIVKTYVELKIQNMRDEDSFHIGEKNKINAKFIFEQAVKNEKEALEAFRITGELLGFALANSVAYTSPQAIFLFGGLSLAGDLIFAPVKQSFEKNLLNIYKNKIAILPSQLSENDAAILGATSLIWNQYSN